MTFDPSPPPTPPLTAYVHKYVEPATWHHLMITHIFARGELQRRYIAIKMILYTCTFRLTQVLRCFPLDTLALVRFFFFFKTFSYHHRYITEAKCKYISWKSTWLFFFFCLFVDAYLRTRPQILLIHTQYDLCIAPQQKRPHKSQIPRDGRRPGPLRHPTAIYI